METDIAHGVNSIHLAAASGSLELMKFYGSLDGCSMDSKSRDGGRTPLHQATQHGHLDVVQFLVENYSNAMDVMKEDDSGVSPFHLAAYNGQIDCF